MSQESADADTNDGRDESVAERSDRNWNDILQELRVTQTGSQIISGFLLTVAFQQRFGELKPYEIAIYGVLVAFAAASTLLGLSVVSLHRARFRHHDKPRIVTIASRLLTSSVWVVAVLTAGVVLFLFNFILGIAAGVTAGILALVFVVAFLVVLPRGIRASRN
jgi:hypothetical protein